MTRVFRGILLCAGILAMSAGAAHAQAIGSIFGTVTDPSGATLPGVTVTVTGPALQQPLVNTTTVSGAYQFPSVPIGTFTVTFELSSFKKATRANVIVATGFNARIDQKLELGQMSEELTVTAASPVVDTKKTTTGSVFTSDILQNIPTARDPWQIINMTPGVQAGINVGGSSSGQQVGLSVYGSGASVQWNLEGGSITDLSSNSSAAYYNFDSFEQIQVVTGGGDVSVQSGGLSINLVTKSGSNVFKGTFNTTFENDAMQSTNVSSDLFASGTSGFLSGNPISRVTNNSVEYGGPLKRNRLWWWAAADHQDINAGVINFFDANAGTFCQSLVTAQRQGATALAGIATYDRLADVQKCLSNDKTVIKNINAKVNYQLSQAHKFQYSFFSDNKIRNARGANANTAKEATTQQYNLGKLPVPTHQVTHTYIATDRLVFNNMFTYLGGGFFLDYQDFKRCGSSQYNDSSSAASYTTGERSSPDCLWNVQPLTIRTTGFNSRSLVGTYQTERPSWEAKTDSTYFVANKLGGDHSLKFGLGWRRNPIMSFSHYSGGVRAHLQCVGNNSRNCGDGTRVALGSAAGYVPYQAVYRRDQLRNNDWWSYNGYLQDSYSRGRLRINGGIRYDWQTSKYLGGCVPQNVEIPDLLPAQCEDATDSGVNPITGQREKIQPFSQWAPRVSIIYDLSGTGKTSVRASVGYYYATKITLADALGGLFTETALTWGPNQNSGACSTTAGAPCWTDANMDGFVQRNELIGTPNASSSRFNLATGVLTPAGNSVDKSTKIARTREFITGIQHELIANLAAGVEYVYRKYDRGTAAYTVGFQPGTSGYPLSQIYTGPLTYTDPVTGLSAPYFVICQGCMRPSGLGAITMTNPRHQTYHGFITTLTKRFSSRWQMQGSLTVQTNPNFIPAGALFNGNGGSNDNPTGVEFLDGRSTIARFLLRLNGSYALPWGITASGNLTVNDGANRTLSINGPGAVYGGVNATGAPTTITYNTLTVQAAGTTRLQPIKLLDLGLQKVVNFNGGRNRVKLMLDVFNVFNINTITNWNTNNLSSANFTAPSGIVPPRVVRVGAQVGF